MNILNFNHPDISQNQQTSLTELVAAGASTLSVINTKGVTVSQLLLVGAIGSEDAEIVQTHAATTPTDTVITLSAALKFSHTTDTPVTILDFNQIEVSRAASLGGSYSVIATIAITPDEEGTTYRDSSGASTDYYKIRYKDSVNTIYSGYSSEIPATGYGPTTLAGQVATVLRLFSKHSNKLIKREDIVQWLGEGLIVAARKIIDLDVDYYVKYGTDGSGAAISFVASQRAYSLPTDFVRSKRWEFSYDGTTYRNADPMDPVNDHPQRTYDQSAPQFYYESSKIIPKPMPTVSTGGMRPRYVYLPSRMANDSDTPDLPLGYEELPVDYALGRACETDQKLDVADRYLKKFETNTELMLSELKTRYPEKPRSVGMFGSSEDAEFADGFRVPGVN